PLFVSLIPICSNAKLVPFTRTEIPKSFKFNHQSSGNSIPFRDTIGLHFVNNGSTFCSQPDPNAKNVPRESAIKGANCSSSKSFFADF
ncbi:hypothetical protein CFP56_018381, partial [Quercus suber]